MKSFLLAAFVPLALAHDGHDHTAESMSPAEFKTAFTDAAIVPEVLTIFEPSVSLYAAYTAADGNASFMMPGSELSAAEAIMPFEFIVENITDAANVTSDTRFVIYMIGPDAPTRANLTGENIRHYLAGNFTVGQTISAVLGSASSLQNSSAAFTEYAAPAPAVGSGVHRYVYLLYVQPMGFNTAGFEAVGVDAADRQNFNLSAFRTQAGLGPAIGGTFFTIDTNSDGTKNTTPADMSSAAEGVSIQYVTLGTLFAASVCSMVIL